MSFCIHCHPFDEIPGAEVLHIRCLFCFALIKGNHTVCIIVHYYERKLRLHLALWSKKKRKSWQILQATTDSKSWRDYSKITSNHYTHLCLLCFVKTAESSCGSAAFLGYRGHKSITDLEAGITNLELCMTFNTKSTYSGLFFWRTKFEHLPMNVPAVMYLLHIFKTYSSYQCLLGLCLCPEYCWMS